ncbi:MAG: tRNA uridine(34) 5-carboxymethylaminomethyl modification radical SAM/GNAT enzyme Elp3, partial [Archaeoglobaceae archaeon]
MQELLRKIAIEIAQKAKSREEAIEIKKKLAKELRMVSIPSNVELLKEARSTEYYEKLRELLRMKPTRSLSGIVVIAVMSSPAKCPHGKCVPCPGGVEFNSPQSYTGLEPAAMRGRQHGYDAFKQVTARLRELSEIGHSVDKAEIIVMGGTFIARDREYRDKFILDIYNALNCFDSKMREERDLEKAKRKNEVAKV